jgi:hypothetical protein
VTPLLCGKITIHSRYILNSAIGRDQTRLKQVKSNPELASGGSRYTEHETKKLNKGLSETSSRLSELNVHIEKTLVHMAECWPAGGLSEGQMEQLENVFVNTAEYRHRLGEKLDHSDNRTCLFQSNIDEILQLIGIDREFDDVVAESFSFRSGRDEDLLHWGAKSFVLR